ncbi:MFS transporter [Streptomyces rimosus]|uniref:MFS transporter n=1 Tax=Streptomyces rimosus TaxID=1927 RepID=UPI0037CDC2E0
MLLSILLTATNFLVVFDGLVVTVALPTIQHDFSLAQTQAQWVMTAYALPLGGLLLFGGRCGDRFGRRRVLAGGLALFAAGLLLAALAPQAWLLFVGRAVQGMGAAFAVPTTFAIISSLRSTEGRNRLFAAVAVAGGLGAAGGAVIGGVVTQGLGWRYVFLLSAPVAVASAVGAALLLDRKKPQSVPRTLDVPGAVLSTTGLMLLVFAITGIENPGPLSPVTVTTFVLSLVCFFVFAVRERTATAPLLRLGMLRVPSFRAAVTCMPANEFAYQGSIFIGLLFLQQVLGYSPLVAGLAFSPLGIVVLCGSTVANRFLHRMRWTTVAGAAQLVSASGLLALAFASPDSAYLPHILPSLLVLGLGTVVGAVAFNVAAGKDIDAGDKGAGYGVYETAKYTAGVFAIAGLNTAAAARSDTLASGNPITALASGYRLAFLIAAVVAVLGGVLVMLFGDPHRRTPGSRPHRPAAVRAHREQTTAEKET